MIQSTPTVALLSASQSSVSGIKLATYELEYWRSIHGEVMTHRNAAKNASSLSLTGTWSITLHQSS